MSGAEPAVTAAQRNARRLAIGAWFALAVLCVLWELWLAPLRPGGSWLVLKVLPLLVPARGLVRGDVSAFQWATLIVLLYVAEATVRAFEPAPYSTLAWIEFALAAAFFAAAIVYLRPFKLAARRRRAERPG
ncbi:DUF2069 domain-containing protein [Betaproteobacteria bacterium PRO7]|jgi:uncharacterized membrane protein|nr:DUF2069 domain-containing protein [Betaproteobacteria bacterium PRO7]